MQVSEGMAAGGTRPVLIQDAESLGDHLIRVVKLLSAHRHQAPRIHPSVDPAAYPVLFALRGGLRRPSDVAALIHSDVSTVSRQLTHFVEAGLVDRRPDPDDGRAQVIDLTDDGRSLLATIRSHRERWIGQLTQSWTGQDCADFTRLLARFGDCLETSLTSHPQDTP